MSASKKVEFILFLVTLFEKMHEQFGEESIKLDLNIKVERKEVGEKESLLFLWITDCQGRYRKIDISQDDGYFFIYLDNVYNVVKEVLAILGKSQQNSVALRDINPIEYTKECMNWFEKDFFYNCRDVSNEDKAIQKERIKTIIEIVKENSPHNQKAISLFLKK